MKKLSFTFLLFLMTLFCYAEKFDTVCGFSLGTTLDDFKESEVFEFVKEIKTNSYWNQRNCICYNFEPYVLKADKNGKEKGFEEINNKKKEYTTKNPVKYAGKNVYSIDLIFSENKLISITLYFYGSSTSVDKKGKLSTSSRETQFKNEEWKNIKEALAEKYELILYETNSTPIPVTSNWTTSSSARSLFLCYNADYVLAKAAKTRALNERLAQMMNENFVPENLVMHSDIFKSNDKLRIVELYTWSFDGECNQPIIVLSDNKALEEIENKKEQNTYDTLKDQI